MTNYEDTAQNLVQNRFDDLEQYADTAFDLTQTYITDLNALITALEIPDLSEISAVNIPAYTPIDYNARPNLGQGIFTELSAEAPNDISNFNDLVPLEISNRVSNFELNTTGQPADFKSNTIQMATLDLPTKPDAISLETVQKPTAPELTFPSEPILNDIVLPNKISFNPGEFNAESPGTIVLDDPTLMDYTAGNYSSELSTTLIDLIAKGFASAEVYNELILDSSTDSLDTIISKLLDVGSSGINVDVETLIYNRGKARLKDENDTLYQQTVNEFGANGFNLPNGVFTSNIARVQKEISDKNDKLNYEIIVNQANLAQSNRQFMLEKSIQLEGVLRNFFSDTENRTFEASKAVAANGFEVIQAKIASYNAKLDYYKTEASVFETKSKAELNAIEFYKAQIQGSEIESNIQKNEITLYVSLVEAQKIRSDIYQSEMAGAKISMEIEQLKISSLELLTKIYLTEVEAEKVKVEIYKEENEAEKVRLESHLANLESYKIKVETEKEKLEAYFDSKKLLLDENNSLIEKYKADLAAYAAKLEANNNFNEKELRAFQATVSAYEAETDADKAKNLMKIEESKTQIQEAQIKLERITSELDLTVKGYVALKDLQIKSSEGIMNVGAQLTASAMTAVNASASYDFSSSSSGTWAYHPDVAVSESTNYNLTTKG